MSLQKINKPLKKKTGAILPSLEIFINTFGKLSSEAENVSVCHALTANSDVESWWSGIEGRVLLCGTEKYFIFCENVSGSCYGTTDHSSVYNRMLAEQDDVSLSSFRSASSQIGRKILETVI